MKREKIYYLSLSIVQVMFICIMLTVLILLVLAEPNVRYWYKREFLMDNYLLFLLSILALGIAFFFFRRKDRQVKGAGNQNNNRKYHRNIFAAVCVTVFFVQLFIALHIFFLPGWDVIYVVQNAKWIAEGNLADLSNSYFSIYNNNLLLVFLDSVIFKLAQKFSVTEMKDVMHIFIMIQCIISTGTGILLFQCVQKLFQNKCLSWLSWLLYAGLVLTSPWVVVPYSDSVSLFIPLCIFYLYLCMTQEKHDMLRWAGIAFLTCLGFHIKPQVVIITIAIVMMELAKNIGKKPEKTHSGSMIAFGCVLLVSQLCFQVMINSMPFTLDKEMNFGCTHFLMMGLNTKSDGGYSDKDVQYSKKFQTREERKEANLEKIRKRVEKLKDNGWGMHFMKKMLVDYGDGSFSFGQEGNFNLETYNNSKTAKFFQEIFYEEGKYFQILSTFQHGIWIFVLTCSLVAGCLYGKESDNVMPVTAVLMLAIIGLSVFELLFEARSRYFYIYAPLYIILAVYGVRRVNEKEI